MHLHGLDKDEKRAAVLEKGRLFVNRHFGTKSGKRYYADMYGCVVPEENTEGRARGAVLPAKRAARRRAVLRDIPTAPISVPTNLHRFGLVAFCRTFMHKRH